MKLLWVVLALAEAAAGIEIRNGVVGQPVVNCGSESWLLVLPYLAK